MDAHEPTVITFTPKSVIQTPSITAGLHALLWDRVLRSLVAPNNVAKLQEFYNSVFPKWFFNALRRGHLDPDTFQLTPGSTLVSVVGQTDLTYFQNVHQIRVKALPESRDDSFAVVTIETLMVGLPTLHEKQIKHAAELYTGPSDDFDADLDYIRGLYEGLGGSSNFLSVPLSIKAGFIELFGSPLNTNNEYCSAFKFERERFSSLGSFFEYAFQPNQKYLANPPFDEQIMEEMALYINKQLDTVSNVTVVVVIPDWRPPFAVRDILDASKYRKSSSLLNRHTHQFYDHRNDAMINVCTSRLYVMSNEEWSDTAMTASKIADKWAALNKGAGRERGGYGGHGSHEGGRRRR